MARCSAFSEAYCEWMANERGKVFGHKVFLFLIRLGVSNVSIYNADIGLKIRADTWVCPYKNYNPVKMVGHYDKRIQINNGVFL